MSANTGLSGNTLKLSSGKEIVKPVEESETDKSTTSDENEDLSSSENETVSKIFFTDQNLTLKKLSDLSVISVSSDSQNFNSFNISETQTEFHSNNNTNLDISFSSHLNSTENEIDNNLHNMVFDTKLAYNVIPDFNGSNIDIFFAKCDFIYGPLVLDEDKANFLLLLKTKFSGPAFEFIKYKEFNDWETLKKDLRIKFCQARSISSINLELGKTKQEPHESIKVFGDKIEKILSELNDACVVKGGLKSMETFEVINLDLALRSFEQGLRNKNIQIIIKACRFNDLNSAINKAIEEEILLNESNQKVNDIPKSVQHSNQNPYQFNKPQCQLCKKIGHTADKCFSLNSRSMPQSSYSQPGFSNPQNFNQPRFQNNNSPIPNHFQNNNSSIPNHFQNQNSHNNNIPVNRAYYGNSSPILPVCRYCHKYGHIIENCRKRMRYEARNYDQNYQNQQSSNQLPISSNSGVQSNSQSNNSENFQLSLDQNLGMAARAQDI